MRARLEALVAALRSAEVAVSTAEAMDAARAAALVGLERSALREALAATLVKNERERATFVAAFDAIFPARLADVARTRGRRRGAVGGEGGTAGEGGGGAGTGASRGGAGPAEASDARARPALTAAERASDAGRPRAEAAGASAATAVAEPEAGRASAATDGAASTGADRGVRARQSSAADVAAPETTDDGAGAADALARFGREHALLRLSFRAMTPLDVEACAELARAIALRFTTRVRRRLRSRPTGRLDFRRTIRAAVSRGGVPFERRWRGRRPGAPDLVALVDLSASTATATDFFLSMLAPASDYFRRVRLYGFVDRLVEIEFVDGQVRPDAPLDLMARSDFGRVLRDLMATEADVLGADTILVILADARNNRFPPRADLLAAARARVRRALWLNPDARERWDTGDSVIAAYARHVDAVVACGTLAELDRALGVVARL